MRVMEATGIEMAGTAAGGGDAVQEEVAGHPREVLRGALLALGTLSAKLSVEEKRLEDGHASQLEKVKSRAEKEAWDAEEWARKQRQVVKVEHEGKLTQAERDREIGEKAAKDGHGRSVLLARRAFEEGKENIKKSWQEGEWLADSMLEGAEAAAKKNAHEAKKSLERAMADLGDREAKTLDTLALYGQQHLVLDPPPTVEGVDTDVDERHAQQKLTEELEDAATRQRQLEGIESALLFTGIKPYAFGGLLVVACGFLGQLSVLAAGGELAVLNPVRVAIGSGLGFVLACLAAIWLKVRANRKVRETYKPLRANYEAVRVWAAAVHDLAMERIDSDLKAARAKRDDEIRIVKDRHTPLLTKAEGTYKAAVAVADEELKAKMAAVAKAYENALAEAGAFLERRTADLEARLEREKQGAVARGEDGRAEAIKAFDTGKTTIRAQWERGLRQIAWATQVGQRVSGAGVLNWSEVEWKTWETSRSFSPAVRFGELDVNVWDLMGEGTSDGGTWRFGEVLAERFAVPGMLAFGEGATSQAGSLMVDFGAGKNARDVALGAIRETTARVLAAMPAGRVRLTMIDPVGLGQTFAGFMHLADYDEQLTGPRIWTDQEQIDKKLSDLTDHMETVIQKYLRNEFETIDAYNAQAGELAEPYRFLVVADFPVAWSPEATRKLISILQSGARCGVHVLMARDSRVQVEKRVLEDLRSGMTVVALKAEEGGTKDEMVAKWTDEVFGRFPLRLDREPSDSELTELCKAVGEGARRANRVEVDFKACLPPREDRWKGSTASEFKVPVGRSGATRLQMLKFGKGVSQHALVAGKTGSGKSTLLHVMVTASAEWFSPDEVEFYLIDFKKGVEFKAYVDGKLPHCKAVAIESDREFGLSVLQRLDAELSRRGELFRKVGVQDLASFRSADPKTVMPRILLVVDEFQEFFSEDDKIAQESSSLIDRLVRQGRAFGMHVMLGSQTIGGQAGLPRATLGQMAVRVALQCSETDSTMILGDSNTAARLLTRPGEAIYNDNGGLPEANSPFQVAWLADERRDQLLAEVGEEAAKRGWVYDAVVFEGNKPVDFATHRAMQQLLAGKTSGPGPYALLGEPVAIKQATRVIMRRQPGANMLLIGQQEEAAMATMQAAITSLSASGDQTSGGARFIVFEGTMQDSPLRGALSVLPQVRKELGESMEMIDYREAEEAIGRVYEELQRRLEDPNSVAAQVFVVVYALQRYRALRKTDDGGFSFGSEEKKKGPDKMLAEIVREGPAVGIHVIAWADTLVSVERVFERGLMREFDHRVLFQMSAADSSSLIDSPAANRLGPVRALLFSEEQGVMEKFRPYGILSNG